MAKCIYIIQDIGNTKKSDTLQRVTKFLSFTIMSSWIAKTRCFRDKNEILDKIS